MMKTLILVALGGALGAGLRFWVGTLVAFPLGTLAVNIAGSGAIGLLWVWAAPKAIWVPFAVTGLLGGFTTFSAFSLDVLRLIEDGRLAAALLYLGVSVFGALAACWAGLLLARSFGT